MIKRILYYAGIGLLLLIAIASVVMTVIQSRGSYDDGGWIIIADNAFKFCSFALSIILLCNTIIRNRKSDENEKHLCIHRCKMFKNKLNILQGKIKSESGNMKTIYKVIFNGETPREKVCQEEKDNLMRLLREITQLIDDINVKAKCFISRVSMQENPRKIASNEIAGILNSVISGNHVAHDKRKSIFEQLQKEISILLDSSNHVCLARVKP